MFSNAGGPMTRAPESILSCNLYFNGQWSSAWWPGESMLYVHRTFLLRLWVEGFEIGQGCIHVTRLAFRSFCRSSISGMLVLCSWWIHGIVGISWKDNRWCRYMISGNGMTTGLLISRCMAWNWMNLFFTFLTSLIGEFSLLKNSCLAWRLFEKLLALDFRS